MATTNTLPQRKGGIIAFFWVPLVALIILASIYVGLKEFAAKVEERKKEEAREHLRHSTTNVYNSRG